MSIPYNAGVLPLDPLIYVAPSITYRVAAGTTESIIPNSLVSRTLGVTGNVVSATADAAGTTTTPVLCGIAQSLSTETATAVGFVDVMRLLPGFIYVAAPKVAIATQAAYNLLIGSRVIIDVTAGVTTIDTAAVDAATNGIVIEPLPLTGDVFNGNKVAFSIRPSATNYF